MGIHTWPATVDHVELVSLQGCGRTSPDNTSPQCETQAQFGVGIIAVAAVLVFGIGYLWWRRKVKKWHSGSTTSSDS